MTADAASPIVRPVVLPVLEQHAEEAVLLWSRRTALSTAPHVKLHHFARSDERLAAHLDGLAVAGPEGARLTLQNLVNVGAGEVFVAAIGAIADKDEVRLSHVFALVGAQPESLRGLLSAFGWTSAANLSGIVRTLLSASDSLRRSVGLAACAMHGADPGAALDTTLQDADPVLRARALRTIGALGEVGRLDAVRAAVSDADPACKFWAAWSGVLAGDRRVALAALLPHARAPGPHRARAMRLGLSAAELAVSHELLRALAQNPADVRALIEGTGIVGDGVYVPWLIKQMGDPKLQRLAGESFSLITGLDLAYLDLDQGPSENFEPGPNDDPADPRVEMDADDDLPWPDPAKCGAWWSANKDRFEEGVRYFLGKPPERAHCIEVLKTGYQRQRRAAAQYLCLLSPGMPLFSTSAPSWRQARLLAKIS